MAAVGATESLQVLITQLSKLPLCQRADTRVCNNSIEGILSTAQKK